jgi:DEAD/DEAH box helicase domain-containing protein
MEKAPIARIIGGMTIASLLAHWQTDPEISDNLPVWRTAPPRPAQTAPLPADLPDALAGALARSGIQSLYTHQFEAWTETRAGRNVILATGTASGKTLAYNLPVLAGLLENPNARALYLFPTKALAQDQLSVISKQLSVSRVTAAIYDGDTPQKDRPVIRRNARIVLSNPDMLHTGILPHHTVWAEFFRGLKFVVIDEAHTYRGVFGSHVANVLRRLKRIAAFYGVNPQFIFASATIGNPQELAERLAEVPVHLIESDGSPRGQRHFLIYNPPVVDPALGLRKSSLLESVRLAGDLLSADVQSLVFARSRRSVEMMLKYLQTLPSPAGRGAGGEGSIRGYRSGYLPAQRREIERGLRDGTVRAVVATNALELGIDIGGLDAAVLVGYPGSISSTRQQAGRAGRGLAPALAVLVASASPLDQFLAHHPEYFFERSPEQALVDPDHLLILLNHLRCAMFELPFQKDEGFGALPAEAVRQYLDFLVSGQEAHLSQDKYFWMADSYPAASLSLRSASPESVALQVAEGGKTRIIGTVDGESASWMAHPGAVYLHEAQTYFVDRLDLEQHIAHLLRTDCDYYTEPLRQTSVELLSVAAQEPRVTHQKYWGELLVTTLVAGFLKRRWYTHENLGQEPLDLPPTTLQTTGYWLSLAESTIERLSAAGVWTNSPNEYGPGWKALREAVRARDGYRCQVCGVPESGRQHDVHHKTPFRTFMRSGIDEPLLAANRPENLVTLCASCHRKVEENVRMRSGLAGLVYVLGQLAPLFLMCDPGDLGTHIEPVPGELGPAVVVLYDLVPAGIGFSQKLFDLHSSLLQRALELVQACACQDGCPSCVGPGGENGMGGKPETLAILREIVVK